MNGASRAKPIGPFDHGRALSILAHADAAAVKRLAEETLASLGAVEVLHSRTGLAMLPGRDTAEGTAFHLGEVLVAEAHLRLRETGVEGYGACVGRDLEHAMAIAVLDAAAEAGVALPAIVAFLKDQAGQLARQDEDLLRRVEATRVEMETF